MDGHCSGDLSKPAEQKMEVIAGQGILTHERDLGRSGRSPKPRYRQGTVLTSRLPQYLKEKDAQQITTETTQLKTACKQHMQDNCKLTTLHFSFAVALHT